MSDRKGETKLTVEDNKREKEKEGRWRKGKLGELMREREIQSERVPDL